MSTISKSWGAEQTIMNAVAVTTGSYSDPVDLETLGYEGAHVTILADFPVTPVDNLEVYIDASIDGSAWDITAFASLILSKAIDPNQVSFIVKDFAFFKLYCKRSGTTDTITVTARVQPWRYQSV